MSATQVPALQRKVTAGPGDLYMGFELSNKQWKLSFGGGYNAVSRFTVGAKMLRARPRWLVARCWLTELGVDNVVVDAGSIEVNCRARRAKTDRLDADKL